jgi:hypothetical protein
MTVDLRALQASSAAELEALFRASLPGVVPSGEVVGTAILRPGSLFSRVLGWFVKLTTWQGKVFDGSTGTLRNRITPLGVLAIEARVYEDPSRVDQKPCWVIDYSRTSWLARGVRDEIREVARNLHLGVIFVRGRRAGYFALRGQELRSMVGRRLAVAAVIALVAIALYALVRLNRDEAVTYAALEDHFKYGSTGGERDAGIPYAVWTVLPKMFPEYLPGPGLESLGFIFEPGKDLPIGVSRRNVKGIDSVFVNCAVCHVGTVRGTPDAPRRIVLGMPANGLDLESFERFLFACATDERFEGSRVLAEMEKHGVAEDFINRTLLRLIGISLMRDRLLMIRQRFLSFLDREPRAGPGRVDTFNPPKVLMNFPMALLPEEEWVGNCDLPSIWLQRQREERGMWLHWDGNNDSVRERNRSAAFGTGATPTTLDRASMKRTEEWLMDVSPPPYPRSDPHFAFDPVLAERGRPLYKTYCARCHGESGTVFDGEEVGKVEPIEKIGTDRARLDSYTVELAANQNLLYAGYPEDRFRRFRKTFGYAKQPLDGVWLRAPYLHNGSVPTLRDLLEPASSRPASFFRGYDVFDSSRVGFVSNVAEEKGRKHFLFDTRLRGNGNAGHEGAEYGTHLPAADKDAIVEHLKTF